MIVSSTILFLIVFKIAIVVPTFRSGDKNILTNYRPTPISTIFLKISGKLVQKKTFRFLKQQSVTTLKQFGFRATFSTTLHQNRQLNKLSRLLKRHPIKSKSYLKDG